MSNAEIIKKAFLPYTVGLTLRIDERVDDDMAIVRIFDDKGTEVLLDSYVDSDGEVLVYIDQWFTVDSSLWRRIAFLYSNKLYGNLYEFLT